MVEFSTDSKIGIFAQSGYGKTYLATEIISFICNHGGRVVVYDTDYNDRRYKWSSLPNCKVFSPKNSLATSPAYLNSFIKELRAKYTNFFIFIDDIDVFFNKSSVLSSLFEELKDISSRGRHSRIGLIYTTKTAFYIPSQLVQNTNIFYVGSFPTTKSIKSLIEFISYSDIESLNKEKHEFLEVDIMSNAKKKVS